jgi:hypothetical protein
MGACVDDELVELEAIVLMDTTLGVGTGIVDD